METKICTKCDEEKPVEEFYNKRGSKDGKAYWCKVCHNKVTKNWIANNPERAKLRGARYDEANRPKRRAKDRKYYQNNVEKVSEKNKNHRETHKDSLLAKEKIYREGNTEVLRKRRAQWAKDNPDSVRDKAAKRRAQKRGNGCENVKRIKVFERDLGVCYLCSKPVDPSDWHLDHIIPISKGGPHTYDNVAVTHPRCNLSKGAKLL